MNGALPDLGAALAAHLGRTLPDDAALEQWLARHCAPAQHELVRAQLRGVVAEAQDAAWHEPGGVRLAPEFWQRLHARLRVRHPWLTLADVQGLQAFLGWFCWHEGLFAADAP